MYKTASFVVRIYLNGIKVVEVSTRKRTAATDVQIHRTEETGRKRLKQQRKDRKKEGKERK